MVVISNTSIAQASEQDENASIGELTISNWRAVSVIDGAHIKNLNFIYVYEVKDDIPSLSLKIAWDIGDQVTINGVSYKRKTLGNEFFEEINISELVLEAEVYSNGEYKSVVTLYYIGAEGIKWGQNGIHVITHYSWKEIFKSVSVKETKSIFKRKFELRFPRVQKIMFTGLKLPEMISIHKDVELITKTNYTYTNSDKPKVKDGSNSYTDGYSNGNIHLKISIPEIISDYRTKNIKKYRGLSWHYDHNFGLEYHNYPIIINESTQISEGNFTTSSNSSYSTKVGGLGLTGGLGLWPIFGEKLGVGGFASLSAGGLPGIYSSYFAEVGLKGYYGFRNYQLMFLVSTASRDGTYFKNTNSYENGLSTYTNLLNVMDNNYFRYGIGPGLKIKAVKPIHVSLMILHEQPKSRSGFKSGTWIIQSQVWMHNIFNVTLEFGPSYNVHGLALFSLKPESKSNGTYFLIKVTKPFDFFGRRYIVDSTSNLSLLR